MALGLRHHRNEVPEQLWRPVAHGVYNTIVKGLEEYAYVMSALFLDGEIFEWFPYNYNKRLRTSSSHTYLPLLSSHPKRRC